MNKLLNRFKKWAGLSILVMAPVLLSGYGPHKSNPGSGSPATGEKKKVITRNVNVSGDELLRVTNSFGDVKINLWDKKEVKVEITITADAGNDEDSQKLLDAIDIKEEIGGNLISFRTKIDKGDDNARNRRNDQGRKSRKFNIDYQISMPAGLSTDLENSFGDMELPDLENAPSIIQKFGKLTAGKLTKCRNIQVEFGSGEVKALQDSRIILQFCKPFSIEKVMGEVFIGSEHSGLNLTGMGNELKNLMLSDAFSHITIKANKESSAKFQIHMDYGSFKNKSNIDIKQFSKEDRWSSQKSYKSADLEGEAAVNITARFCTLRIE